MKKTAKKTGPRSWQSAPHWPMSKAKADKFWADEQKEIDSIPGARERIEETDEYELRHAQEQRKAARKPKRTIKRTGKRKAPRRTGRR